VRKPKPVETSTLLHFKILLASFMPEWQGCAPAHPICLPIAQNSDEQGVHPHRPSRRSQPRLKSAMAESDRKLGPKGF
jgi:hypothetical protein